MGLLIHGVGELAIDNVSWASCKIQESRHCHPGPLFLQVDRYACSQPVSNFAPMTSSNENRKDLEQDLRTLGPAWRFVALFSKRQYPWPTALLPWLALPTTCLVPRFCWPLVSILCPSSLLDQSIGEYLRKPLNLSTLVYKYA